MNPLITSIPDAARKPAPPERTLHRLFTRFRDANPVFWKDLTITLRTQMYVGSLVLTVVALGLLAVGVGVAEVHDPTRYVAKGRMLFEFVLGVAALVMALMGSNLSASAIAQEREARTLDPLTLSALGPRRIVLGKFGAAFVATGLVAVAALPILVPIVAIGEISLSALAMAMAGQLVFAAVVVAIGLALSAHAESTRRISLLAVVLALVGTLGTGAVLTGLGEALGRGAELDIKGPYFFSEAYFVVPLSAKYVLGLVLLPAYALTSVLSLSYLTARAGLMAPSEDRTFAIKGWAVASVSGGGGLSALAVRALHFSASDARAMAAAWAAGTALLALGLLFLFVAEPVIPSRRSLMHPRRGLQRLAPACLGPSILFVLVGTAFALPIGVVAIVGFDSDAVVRAVWGAAYVGAVGGFVGFVAARDPKSRPTAARALGVLTLLASGIGVPVLASALEESGGPTAEINALSPGWVTFHGGASHDEPLVAGGAILLALTAAFFIRIMLEAAAQKREKLSQRPAV